MKTKQSKDETNKPPEDDSVSEPKTRARKKASDAFEEGKSATVEPKTSTVKRVSAKTKVIAKKGLLGVRKTLRNKKVVAAKDKQKNVIKQGAKRGRKPAVKTEPITEEQALTEVEPLISASEIKNEPAEDIAQSAQSSRSSSPKTASRRQRLSSDMIMMKSVLSDSPSPLVVGSRTSPYSTRSERSNSPSIADKRRSKPRKLQNNLRNEVVIKEQKKRRRLLSDSKSPDSPEAANKRVKRGRSCSRDGSEVSKCSDITESDISLSETPTETDNKELNKKTDKPKTDLDVDNENVQISSIEQVPSETDVPISENQTNAETTTLFINNKTNNKPMSLTRSSSLDSDNNNSNKNKLDTFNSLDVDDKANLLLKTGNENITLSNERSSILTSMFKTFNSKEVTKNIRKARRGRKTTTNSRPTPSKSPVSSTTINAQPEDKAETIETLSKEIDDLISNLDQSLDEENENVTDLAVMSPVNKTCGLPKPLTDSNSIASNPEMIVKDKTTPEESFEITDDSENIKLRYEDDPVEEVSNEPKQEITFKCTPAASIDKLMDRLKEFEEFDKRRQRQESESKPDSKTVMVTSDVVLIPKSGADIKTLIDHKNLSESMKSPQRPVEKENVLSCFENNSAISIVKRDHMRKSIDVDITNSVSLIKRNSISRKESTGSNNSRESNDAISIFEKSLGKDVTLTEIRKSVDKPTQIMTADIHHLATLQPTKPSTPAVSIEHKEKSMVEKWKERLNKIITEPEKVSSPITKQRSRDSVSRKSSETAAEADDKMAKLEKIVLPATVAKSIAVVPLPVAIKSPEMKPMEIEPLAPPVEIAEAVPENIPTASEAEITKKAVETKIKEAVIEQKVKEPVIEQKIKETTVKSIAEVKKDAQITNSDARPDQIKSNSSEVVAEKTKDTEVRDEVESKISESADVPKTKSPNKGNKSARNSTENEAGPSNLLHETPESQKRKESVLRTLGLLTHKAAKEVKIEKEKEKERIYGVLMNNKKSKSGEYTGTLKTVIKLNRNSGEREKKKHRSSLKITFQKSKVRPGKQSMETGETLQDEYYTIERKEVPGSTSDGGHRKSHYSNRLNHDGEAEPSPEVKEPTLNLVIPEKASSFSIHPGRLCMDQCFYCGGKFGLFDTPCHIAQMKSADRQKKVLDNEEKLTVDSCLCDACYRHVDRRANCPSYRKRPPLKQPAYPADGYSATQANAQAANNAQQADKTSAVSPPMEDESSSESTSGTVGGVCHVEGCTVAGDRYIRRKWLIKMRTSVNKVLRLRYDYPGLQTIPLCSDHYRLLSPLTVCALCRRSLLKHHNVHTIHHGYTELNPLLKQAGIPVEFADRPVLCKLCRYYCTLLQRPGHNDQHALSYRRRLLQLHNIEVPPEPENNQVDVNINTEENTINKHKKKSKNKKQRKSTEPERQEGEERLSESPPTEKERKDESTDSTKHHNIEEDIESLISSNRILIPAASKNEEEIHAEDPQFMDKQTELQYLLQKQNNPAQFLSKPNLTQKAKNVIKVGGVQKSGLQQRINDKNAKRIQRLGQIVYKDKKEAEMGAIENITCIQTMEVDKSNDVYKTLSEECTIETVPNKKQADINMLKNKWQMSESFTQVKRNLSELSKKFTIDKTASKASDLKYSNPVKRLETNPSISVRELFPGEEEMNLQCNIEFHTVKGVTPEGWEKCASTIQYDAETKRMWNDLQKPYGNQSSFLRHLVLLERYFRNGDLVLSPNATPSAVTYSDSVQNRLRSYDNVPFEPKRPEKAVSLIEFRKKPSISNKSLLKTNQPIDKDNRLSMPPPDMFPKPKQKDKQKSKPLPPELIAINTPTSQGRKAIQNVIHNIQQLVKTVSASDPVEVASSPIPATSPIPVSTPVKVDPPREPSKAENKKDAPKKQKNSSKPWRPTLMPITPENLAKIAREKPQIAVDGRSLPSLVQVKASEKRYHITIEDYNKMCIMRRDKLQQLQEGKAKAKRPSIDTDSIITEIQPSITLGSGGSVKQSFNFEKQDQRDIEMTQIGNAATILKNVGLKNITIAPIPAKTSTVTSQTLPPPIVSSPSILVASAPIKIPQLGPAVSITSETILTPNFTPISTVPNQMIMPKIPKSLTVIPQTVTTNSMGMATLTNMAALNSLQAMNNMTVGNMVVTPSSSDVNRP